jgi:3'-5' exoribonuclease
MHVVWTVSQPDTRLRAGCLVSIRWQNRHEIEDGAYRINRLVLLEIPEPWENLLHLVPHDWVSDRELVQQAAELVEELPRPFRFLFNAIFWDGQRFYRYCTVPYAFKGTVWYASSNLRRAIEVAHVIREMGRNGEIANDDIGIVAALLHESGRADEYRQQPSGIWELTERGRLLGHRITAIEWISQARGKWNLLLPEDHYIALLKSLCCAMCAPEFPGSHRPAIVDATLLTSGDHPLTTI